MPCALAATQLDIEQHEGTGDAEANCIGLAATPPRDIGQTLSSRRLCKGKWDLALDRWSVTKYFRTLWPLTLNSPLPDEEIHARPPSCGGPFRSIELSSPLLASGFQLLAF